MCEKGMKNVPIVSVGINIKIFEKTWHMGSVCNVHFCYLRQKCCFCHILVK